MLAAALVMTHANAQILVHGHRGARAVLPENTLAAFEYAIDTGADFIELDLAVTRDDVLVVSHDPVLKTNLCQGDGPTRVVREMRLAELKKWDCGSLRAPGFPEQRPVPGATIPTLDEVLALANRGDFHFNIELKLSPANPQYAPSPEEFTRMVVEAVRRHGLEKRVLIQSFDFRVLRAAGKIAPEIPLAALFSGRDEDFVTIARETGAGIVAPSFNLVTNEKVRQAQAAGLRVVPWTANTKEAWDTLIAAGVNAIITDDPAGLIEHLKQKGLR